MDQLLSPPRTINPAQCVGTADVGHGLPEEDRRLRLVLPRVEHLEVRHLELLEHAVPEADDIIVGALHLEAAPVEVNVEEELVDAGHGAVDEQVLQHLPLGALQVGAHDVNLEDEESEGKSVIRGTRLRCTHFMDHDFVDFVDFVHGKSK